MTAIFLHIYYRDKGMEMLNDLTNVRYPFNLYVNLVDGASHDLIDFVLFHFPKAVINISPNQGMDPGGQLRTLRLWMGMSGSEEFIIFLHTKKDDSLRALFSSIVYAPKDDLMHKSFLSDSEVGMIGVEEWNLYPGKMYGDPIHYCDYYCDMLGLNNFQTNKFGFIGGTMFCVRSKIFKDVFSKVDILKLVEELPPYETGGKTHALERIFGYVVLSEGYKIKGI